MDSSARCLPSRHPLAIASRWPPQGQEGHRDRKQHGGAGGLNQELHLVFVNISQQLRCVTGYAYLGCRLAGYHGGGWRCGGKLRPIGGPQAGGGAFESDGQSWSHHHHRRCLGGNDVVGSFVTHRLRKWFGWHGLCCWDSSIWAACCYYRMGWNDGLGEKFHSSNLFPVHLSYIVVLAAQTKDFEQLLLQVTIAASGEFAVGWIADKVVPEFLIVGSFASGGVASLQ